MTIGAATKYAKKYANGNYGYSQGSGKTDGRWSGETREPGNFDCSSFCGVVAYKGGFILRSVLKGTFYTGNFVSKLTKTGMYTAISARGLSLSQLKAKCKEGDFLLGPGHVVYCLGGGKCVSFEADERGKSTGGKPGDQTGKEGRIRDLYARSRGWTHIVRPKSFATLMGPILAAKFRGKSYASAMDLLKMRAPWDGPRFEELLKRWDLLDKGMSLNYSPWKVMAAGHIFVVLGSGLSSEGKITKKFKARLDLVIEALEISPNSKVLITGGAPKKGVTEAAAGQEYLLSKGVQKARILVETKSASTVGNALNSTPILAKFIQATLVTHASHARRAQIEFLAAQAKADIKVNRRGGPVWSIPLVINDYGTGVVKPTRPVNKATREAVVREVAILLGYSKQLAAAL